MKPEEIMKALQGADDAYLDKALGQPPRKSFRSLRPGVRLCLIAALLLMMGGTVYAAWTALNVESRQAPEGWYEVYFQENPAAPDAPESLEEYYLPAVSSDTFIRESTTLNFGNAFATESRIVWTYGDPWKKMDEEIDRWNKTWACDENGRPKALSSQELAALEKEHPLPSVKTEQLIFSQKPLLSLPNDKVLDTYFSDAGPLTKGGVRIGSRDYVTMGNADETIYLWTDEALHYVFYLRCSNGIPRSEQEKAVCSVAKVGRESYLEQTGLANAESRTLWIPGIAPTAFQQESMLLVLPDRSEDLSVMLDWQDESGHRITFAQGFSYTEEDLADSEHTTRSLNGSDITVLRRMENVDGHPWIDENWYFIIPGSGTSFWINYYSTDGTEVDEEVKLALYESIQPVQLPDLLH